MDRRLTLALAVLASLAPANALGLGLGDIRLHSALNQPLDAEIDLLAATDDEVNSIKVRLASPDQFDRYGIDRIAALASLKFDVVKRPNGRAYVHITSDQALREPFLTFLVEASWPRGRLLREYPCCSIRRCSRRRRRARPRSRPLRRWAPSPTPRRSRPTPG